MGLKSDSMEKAETQKLAKYSKKDIIDALVKLNYAGKVLAILEEEATEKAFREYDAACAAVNSASQAYIDWQKEISKKYGGPIGDIRTDITVAEMEQGLKLISKMEKAKQEERRVNKKLRTLLKI